MTNTTKRHRTSWTLPDKKTRLYFEGATIEEAERKKAEAQSKYNRGYNIGSKATFADLSEIWLENYKAQPNLHKRTKETTEEVFTRYLLPSLGKMKIQDIKPMHIDRLLREHSQLSVSRQKKILSYAGKIFNMAIENDLIPKSPTLNKKPTAEKSEKVKPLTDDQCRSLLAATKGTRVYPFIVVLLFCGLRKGEALGLMWKDIDFKNNMMSIERSIVYLNSNKKGEVNNLLKTDASRRKIPMSPEVVEVLKKEKQRTKSVYVFAMQDGNFLSESSFRSMWKLIDYRTIGGPSTGDYVEKTLDFHVHPHQLRHTFCTRCLANGMTPKEVQYLMGHATADMTMNVYGDYLAQQQLQSTAKKMAESNLSLVI